MKRNHQNRNVIQQLSTHFRYALLVLVLVAPSAYAAPVLHLLTASLRPIQTTTESYRATKRVIISSSKFSLHAMRITTAA